MCIKLDNVWLNQHEIAETLLEIAEDASKRPLKSRDECVSILTSDDRRNWAKAREILRKGNLNLVLKLEIVFKAPPLPTPTLPCTPHHSLTTLPALPRANYLPSLIIIKTPCNLFILLI